MLHSVHRAVLSLASALLPTVLPAQELIAVNFAGDAYGVDILTGQPRFVAATGVTACNAMALRSGVLYAGARAANGNQQFVAIDPITAQATVLVPNFGFDLRGLCHDVSTDVTFGVVDTPTADRLVRIDVATGVVTDIGSTGMTGIQALAADGSVGSVLGWDVNLGLVRVNTTTGVATDVVPALGAQGANIQFLVVVTDNSGSRLLGGNSALFEIHRFTGVITPIGSGGLADLRGAEVHRGRATPFGSGCLTATGASATISAKNDFLPLANVSFLSPGHAPDTVGLLLVGLSNTAYQGIPLPLDVDPIFGTSGCDLLVSPDLQILTIGAANGLLAQSFQLLSIPGFVLHCQFLTLEAVPGGFSFSSGLTVQTPF